MSKSRRLSAALTMGLVGLGLASVATASTYPARFFPGAYFVPRLPDTGSCFERHFGQLRNVCTTGQMVVASWSPWEIAVHPGTGAPILSAPVDFDAWVNTSASTRVDECEALIVDRNGWAASWTGRVATTAAGGQNLHIGRLQVSLLDEGVIVECTIGRGGSIGTIHTFAAVV